MQRVMNRVDRFAIKAGIQVAGTRQFTKFPGNTLSVRVSFNHMGPQEGVAAVWGVAPGSDTIGVLNKDQMVIMYGDAWDKPVFVVSCGNDISAKLYSFTLSAKWPDGFYPEFADSFLRLFGTRKGWFWDVVHQDIYGCPPPWFGDITYTYS